MQIRRRISHLILRSKGSRKPIRPRRSMIRAPIPALITRSSPNIRSGNSAGVGAQRGVHVIRINRDLAVGRIPSHVLVEDAEDGLLGRLVAGEDARRPEQAALLARVPVELDGVLGGVLGVG